MTQPLPIEQHYGASELIKSCWQHDDSPAAWRMALHKLHGAAMASDETLRPDLWLLVELAQERLNMITPNWRTL